MKPWLRVGSGELAPPHLAMDLPVQAGAEIGGLGSWFACARSSARGRSTELPCSRSGCPATPNEDEAKLGL